ncbi:transposase, partial [Bradyrhizobium sp. LTSP857]
FGWRRQLREAAGGHSEIEEVQFVPAVVDVAVPAPALGRERKVARCKPKPDVRTCRCDAGIIEIEVDGITIRAGRGADTAMIASIVQALKASR